MAPPPGRPSSSILNRLLPLLCFYLVAFNCCLTVGIDGNQELDVNLERELLAKIRDFKVRYHRSLEKARMMRGRKSHYKLAFDDQGFVAEQLSVKSLEPTTTGTGLAGGNGDLDGVTCWAAISNSEEFYLAWGLSNGSLVLAHFNGPRAEINVRRKFQDQRLNGVPYKLKHFVHDQFLWLVVAYRASSPTVEEPFTLAVYQINGTVFKRRQTIVAHDQIDMDIIQTKGHTYMALSIGSEKGDRARHEVRLFTWHRTMFDETAKKLVPGVRSVSLLRIATDIYMATAVNTHDSPIGSPLLLYNPEDKHPLAETQNIEVWSARKVVHFNVDGNDYLLFIGQSDAVIYWWSGDGFLNYQTLADTENARDVDALKLYDGEILLTILYDDRIKFFSANTSWNFELAYTKTFSPTELNGAALGSVQLISYANKYLYSLFTFEGPVQHPSKPLWKLKLLPKYTTSDRDWDPLVTCLMEVGVELQKRDNRLRTIAAKADTVWVTNKVQTITAPVIVKGQVHLEGPVTNVDSIIVTTGNGTTVPQITNSEVKRHLDNATAHFGRLAKEMQTVVRTDRPQQRPIRGKITFVAPVQAARAKFGVLSKDVILNGVPFLALATDSLLVAGDQRIRGQWTFSSDLNAKRVWVNGRLNNIRTGDILLLNSNQTQIITGNLLFNNLSVPQVVLPPTGRINGIQVADLVTTKPGPPQVIIGRKYLRVAEVKGNVQVLGFTNGKDLSRLEQNAIRLDSPQPQIITGNIRFEGPIDVLNFEINGLINGRVNVTKMAKEGLTRTGHNEIISGPKIFYAPINVQGNMTVTKLINGLDFHRDIVTTSTVQDVHVPLVFQAPVKFNADVQTKTVNGIALARDAVLRIEPKEQVITGRKGFLNGLHVNGNVSLLPEATIDGVDPVKLEAMIINRENAHFEGPLVFEKLIVNGNVEARNQINGYNINDLLRLIWLRSADQTIDNPVSFLTPVDIASLRTDSINRMAFPDEFILRSSPHDQIITGLKNFADEMSIPNGTFATGHGVKVNGIDLVRFSQDMVRNLGVVGNSTDNINGIKIFEQLIIRGNVLAAKVNGIDLRRDILTVNGVQTIHGPLEFLAPITHIKGNLLIRGSLTTDRINGQNLTEWSKDLVLLGSDTIRTRPIKNKNFPRSVKIESLAVNGTLGGIDLNHMKSSVVTLNSSLPQQLSAKNFTGRIRFQGPVTINRLNGLDLKELVDRVITRHRPGPIFGEKTIRGRLTVQQNLDVTGFINGLNLTQIQSVAVMKNRNSTITAPMIINGNVFISALSIDETRRLDGVRMKDLVYLNRDITINGTISFQDSVEVGGNLATAKGIINKCNLRQLASEAISLKNPMQGGPITGRKVIQNLEITGNLNSNGYLNNLNIAQLARRTAKLRGPQTLKGLYTFADEVTVGNLVLLNKLNGVNLTHIFTDAVYRSRNNQVVTGTKIFISDVQVEGGSFYAGADLRVKGFVNGVNVTKLDRELVKRDRNQIISGIKKFMGPHPVTFGRNLTAQGLIGNDQDPSQLVNIPQDLVLKNLAEDIIPGGLAFNRPVRFKQNLDVLGSLNGVDVRTLDNRITLSGNQLISGNFTFKDPLKFDVLVVHKTINGIPVDNLVIKDHNLVLRGNYDFTEGFVVRANLSLSPKATINDVNIRQLANHVIDIRRPANLTGTTYFTGPVRMAGLEVRDSINREIKTHEMQRQFVGQSRRINQALEQFRHNINSNEDELKRQKRDLTIKPTTLKYFEPWQKVLDDRFSPYPALDPIIRQLHLTPTNEYEPSRQAQFPLTVRGVPALTAVMHWNRTSSQFELSNYRYSWKPRAVLFVKPGLGDSMLVIANDKTNVQTRRCSKEQSSMLSPKAGGYGSFFTQPLNVYRNRNQTFEFLQTLDIEGVSSIDTFTFKPSETYLAAASKSQGRTFILKLRGQNHFELAHSFSSPGVEMIKALWSKEGDLILAISSSEPGQSKLLRAAISGPVPIFKNQLANPEVRRFVKRSDLESLQADSATETPLSSENSTVIN